jgi:hypothetical protein
VKSLLIWILWTAQIEDITIAQWVVKQFSPSEMSVALSLCVGELRGFGLIDSMANRLSSSKAGANYFLKVEMPFSIIVICVCLECLSKEANYVFRQSVRVHVNVREYAQLEFKIAK